MSIVAFDTLKFVNRLKEAGCSQAQSEAQAEVLSATLDKALATTLATKADSNALNRRIDKVIADNLLVQWMLALLIAAEVLP